MSTVAFCAACAAKSAARPTCRVFGSFSHFRPAFPAVDVARVLIGRGRSRQRGVRALRVVKPAGCGGGDGGGGGDVAAQVSLGGCRGFLQDD